VLNNKKGSSLFKMSISLRVLVVSIKWVQVCLVLSITDDGNQSLHLIGRVRGRVVSKCRASWQCMRGLAPSLTDRSSFPLVSGLWNLKVSRLVWFLNWGCYHLHRAFGNLGKCFVCHKNWNRLVTLLCPDFRRIYHNDELFCPEYQEDH
jgi:hypothetical protein